MNSSYQDSHCNREAILSAPRARELFNSLFVPASQSSGPCPRHGGNQSHSPQPEATSASPVTINSHSSTGSSPCLLPGPLQLSTGTLFKSDFPIASDCSNTSSATQDAPSNINTPSPNGHLIPGSWTVGRETSREALDEYQKDYKPQVDDASKRLQKILGLRNEEAFQPPMPVHSRHGGVTVGNVVDFNPALRHLRGSNAGLGIQIGQLRSGPGPVREQTSGVEATAEDNRRLHGGQGILQGEQRSMFEKPLTLRESLVMHGRQPYGNPSRTQLRSLTFHDLTPDMRTGGFKNEMLAHFEADAERRTNLVSYEVDVPITERHQPVYSSTGTPIQQTERWISFLISVPFISFKAGTTKPAFPPNLPCQHGRPPTSWLIFAAPAQAITSHPPSKDNIISRSTSGDEDLRFVTRYDYDFSHNGIPAFEFMNKRPVLGNALNAYLEQKIDGPFLSGKGVGAYEGEEDFIHPPVLKVNQEYDEEVVKEDVRRWEDVENLEVEMANSCWWKDAVNAFEADQKTWARIKESMSRGCCRIVIRVEEGGQQSGWVRRRTGMITKTRPLKPVVVMESYD